MVEKKTTKTTKKAETQKKTVSTRKPKSLVLEIAKEGNQKEICKLEQKENCKKGCCCRKIIHILEFLLLIANFIVLLIVLCQIKKVNYRTELWNWGEEHFKTLESLYKTDGYKNYVEDQIYNLEATLQNYSNDSYNYEDYDEDYDEEYENYEN